MNLHEETISRSIIFNGRIFTVAKDRVRLPDGSLAERELVLHAGGAGILPLDENGNVTLVRQYRAGAAEPLVEICAGKLEKGEDPLACAKRELSEELGMQAAEILPLGYFYPTPAYDSEKTYLFLARGIVRKQAHLDEGEFLLPLTLPLAQALEMALDGRITDGKTQLALLKAERIVYGTR